MQESKTFLLQELNSCHFRVGAERDVHQQIKA